MKIIVTGYNGSGSSAICSLLKEFDSCSFVDRETYEHLLLYYPNGLFDLEYKLLKRNNMLRSDEAIKSFYNAMLNLYKNDYYWCGGYKKIVGEEFLNILENFKDNIIQYSFEGFWAYDMKEYRINLTKIFKDVIKIMLGKNVHTFGRSLKIDNDNVINISLLSDDEFYKNAKKFVNDYINLFKITSKENIIFDHLLLPQHINLINSYFDEDTRVIIVERDLRDLYLNGKYIRSEKGFSSKYPKKIEDFVSYWKSIKRFEVNIENDKILFIKLEDIIFNYEDTLEKLKDFLRLKTSDHIYKGLYFSKSHALENSRFFMRNTSWAAEVELLKSELEDYLYDFSLTDGTEYED